MDDKGKKGKEKIDETQSTTKGVSETKGVIRRDIEILSGNEREILERLLGSESLKYTRVSMAALSSLPWVGSVISAAAALSSENDQQDMNKFIYLWVKEHEEKLKQLSVDLNQIFGRFKEFGDRINKRIESEEYIALVKATFSKWDQAETLEKRNMLRKLITNAGGISIVQDDWVRFFLDWIEKYHEFHFQVISKIYNHPRITRGEIWQNLRGEIPEERSAEADLFRLLIRDLSTGGVIRQESTSKGKGKSAFDRTDPYILTELGSQFVHYVMDDLSIQIEGEQTK